MMALLIYNLRSSFAGKVVIVALLLVAVWIWHFGFACKLVFNDAGLVTGALEYGADRPFREVTETLPFAILLIMLIAVGMTAHLAPALLRKGFLDSIHAKPLTRPAMLMSVYVTQFAIIAIMGSLVYAGTWLAWGVQYGTWTHWLPELAGAHLVESAGLASVMLLFGVVSQKTAATSVLTILVGIVSPALFEKLATVSVPGSLASELSGVGMIVIPRTLLASNEICLGMGGHQVSFVHAGQILVSGAVWVLLAVTLFVRRDY
jgi:hypothetical protein